MEVRAIKTKVFRENEDLVKFILQYFKKLPEDSILVITSKIVALSEGRTVPYTNEKDKQLLIKKESDFAMRGKIVWLSIKDGMIMANAGIDESNAKGKLILLPKDSFDSANFLRRELKKKFRIKNLGVLVTDSRLMPLRAGVVGVALGYAGFKGIRNYIGKKDIFNRKLKFSQTDVADSLATAAVLCMGEGKEQRPLALVTNPPVEFTEKLNKKELRINPKDDLYLPLFRSILKK